MVGSRLYYFSGVEVIFSPVAGIIAMTSGRVGEANRYRDMFFTGDSGGDHVTLGVA